MNAPVALNAHNAINWATATFAAMCFLRVIIRSHSQGQEIITSLLLAVLCALNVYLAML